MIVLAQRKIIAIYAIIGERIGDLSSDRWRPRGRVRIRRFTTTTRLTRMRATEPETESRATGVPEVRWRRIVRLPETKRFAVVLGATRTCRSAARCACPYPREADNRLPERRLSVPEGDTNCWRQVGETRGARDK